MKITATLWSQENSEGECPIYIVVRHKNKRRTLSTGFSVKPADWNENRSEVRSGHDHAEELNALIAALLSEGKRMIVEGVRTGIPPTPARMIDELRTVMRGSGSDEFFFVFVDKRLEEYLSRGQVGTHTAYSHVIDTFKSYAGSDLPMRAVTPDLVRGFEATRRKKVSYNSVAKELSVIRVFTRKAEREGHLTKCPFRVVKFRWKSTTKRKLTTGEVKRIASHECDGARAEAKRFWMFSFFVGGMRFSDVATLKRKHIYFENEWRVKYRMRKTDNVQGVPLVGGALEILTFYDFENKKPDDYVFPILSWRKTETKKQEFNALTNANECVNNALKQIGGAVGIEHLCFHDARHSAAGRLLEAGEDIYVIQKVLGHSSIATTEHYLKGFTTTKTDAAVRSLEL